MNEIKQALVILKNRWPEVTLIIALWLLQRLITLLLRIYPDLNTLAQLVTIIMSLFIFVVWIGFLRTVYLQKENRQSLPDLVRTGKHLFWRFLGLAILGGLAIMLFLQLLRIIFFGDAIPPLASRISGLFIKLILVKLTLLIPAIIIVTDCSISKSFSIMWNIKLLKAKPLLIFYLIAIVILPSLILFFFPDFWCTRSSITWADTIPTMYYIISRILFLMVYVMAVRFVSSLNINCSENQKTP